jgi:hypothetical protein
VAADRQRLQEQRAAAAQRLIAQAQAMMRANRLAGAIGLYESAAAMRPDDAVFAEAQAASGVQHPRIVRVTDCGFVDAADATVLSALAEASARGWVEPILVGSGDTIRATAAAATVIASQAVITGAFSLTQQASQLGYLPRLRIVHTSEKTMGQIYVPWINWLLTPSTAHGGRWRRWFTSFRRHFRLLRRQRRQRPTGALDRRSVRLADRREAR